MGKYEGVLEEGRGPRVPRSSGPKDQDISNSHSNTSLTLKKVHLVLNIKLVTYCIAFDVFKNVILFYCYYY